MNTRNFLTEIVFALLTKCLNQKTKINIIQKEKALDFNDLMFINEKYYNIWIKNNYHIFKDFIKNNNEDDNIELLSQLMEPIIEMFPIIESLIYSDKSIIEKIVIDNVKDTINHLEMNIKNTTSAFPFNKLENK